jgi:hypothetical protein
MLKRLTFTGLTLLLPSFLWGQSFQVEFKAVSALFKSFKYEQVIDAADSLLTKQAQLSEEETIDLFRMKAISHYILGQQGLAWNSFEQLLVIDKDYKLDPVQNSPKIIKFFNNVYDRFTEEQVNNIIKKNESTTVIDTLFLEPQNQTFSKAFLRSALFPGWGHLYLGQEKKGLYFSLASVVALGSSVYLVIDKVKKERSYLNETDQAKIEPLYKDYNKTYKLRNLFLGAFTIFWIYAQFDLSESAFTYSSDHIQATLIPSTDVQSRIALQFSYSF